MCESLTDRLTELSKKDAGFTSVQESISNVVGTLGQMAATSSTDAELSIENNTKSISSPSVQVIYTT